MNIAFPALVVFLLLLPGILLRYAYRRGAFRKTPISLGPLRRGIAAGVIWALAFRTISLSFLFYLGASWLPDVETVLSITSGNADQLYLSATETKRAVFDPGVLDNLRNLFLYLVLSTFVAYCFGLLLHSFVRRRHLDLRYHFLQFENEWFYLFKGKQRIIAAPSENKTFESIKTYLKEYPTDWLYASVVIEQGGKPFLYWGHLVDYYFGENGDLDKIILEKVQRQVIEADDEENSSSSIRPNSPDLDHGPEDSDRFYPIKGDYLVIRLNQAMNLNIDYGSIEKGSLPEPPRSTKFFRDMPTYK